MYLVSKGIPVDMVYGFSIETFNRFVNVCVKLDGGGSNQSKPKTKSKNPSFTTPELFNQFLQNING